MWEIAADSENISIAGADILGLCVGKGDKNKRNSMGKFCEKFIDENVALPKAKELINTIKK